MPLSAGDRLGPYEILSAIGAGGMGEVYKARDTRLNRAVAIKVLPEHIAQREDLRARFEREARAVASLNHPNICSLFDVGPSYMVMELIEGETLADRIAKGPIPLAQALKHADQIADALDRAHRAGVTHRDVKPQNIMLTRDGVKVLDFGLAKSGSRIGAMASTMTAGLTTEGTVLGTPQYMAPEQLEGKEADARSDIWAFGAVLYEMVTGRKAFQGKSYASLAGAILAADPPPMSARRLTPGWLERLVRRCLAKDPEDRWQSMRDVVVEMRSPPESAASGPSNAARWPWAVAGLSTLAFLVAGTLLYQSTRPEPPRPLMRLKVEAAPGAELARGGTPSGVGGHMLAISPDGTRLALTLRGADGKSLLHTRLLNQIQATPLAGTEGAHSPFFSPAGDWIAFFAQGKLKKIPVEGGAAVTLCEAPRPLGGSWGDDDTIVASLTDVLARIPASGGTPVPVTKLNEGDGRHGMPQVLPGSQTVLFTVSRIGLDYYDSDLDALSLATGQRKTIQRAIVSGRYLASPSGSNGTGHLIYLRHTTLFAVPFQLGSLSISGSPAAVLEDVSSTGVAGGDYAFSQNGTFLYPARVAPWVWPIMWVDRSSTMQPLHETPGQYFYPALSPDGKRLAFSADNGKGADIWVKDLERDTLSQLTLMPGTNSHAVWTPDGKDIIFRSTTAAAPGLYGVRADGSGEAARLTDGKIVQFPHSMSPNGEWLAVQQNGDIFTLPIEPDPGNNSLGFRLGQPVPFLQTPHGEVYPAFSPDGHWMAYLSVESGTYELYVRPFPGPGGRWQISTGGGTSPRWSRDTRELLFLNRDGRMMTVSYTANGETFAAGKPQPWMETRLQFRGSAAIWDLAPDGKRIAAFIGSDPGGEKGPTHLMLLLNFFDELQRRVPAGK